MQDQQGRAPLRPHTSYLRFSEIRLRSANGVDQLLKAGKTKTMRDLDPAIVARFHQAICSSDVVEIGVTEELQSRASASLCKQRVGP
jgi:hypothetical protein